MFFVSVFTTLQPGISGLQTKGGEKILKKVRPRPQTLDRVVTGLTTLLAALLLEWTVGPVVSLQGVTVPLFAAVLFFWFWRLNLFSRLWLGISSGIILDSIYPETFGAYLIGFLLIAMLTEFLFYFFSQTESFLTQGVSLTVSLFLFPNAAFISSSLLAEKKPDIFPFLSSGLENILLASFFWAILLPGILGVLNHFWSLPR